MITPAIRLPKGIYHVEAFYNEHGIAKAALVYDVTNPAKGRELVDDNEFDLDSKSDSLSYRVRLRDDSPIRFRLRLTGDAVEGDYVQLLRVRIISSRLTYGYRLFCLMFLLLSIDFLVWGYLRYYRKWEPEEKVIFPVLVIAAFFAGLPLYRNGLPYGNDLAFHLNRIEGLRQGLLAGQFPVRIQPGWLDGYGYASSVFYGDIFLYIPAILSMIGFTLQDAYKCYVVIINVASILISFYAFGRISRNRAAACAASVLYICSIGRLEVIYSAVAGGYSAMMFYPLIVAGFWLLVTADEQRGREYKKVWMLLTIGFTGLLMTHMISCLMVLAYAILFCLVMARRIWKKGAFWELAKAAGVAVLLNLWFLVPFLQYMLGEKLRINSGLSQSADIADYPAAMAAYTKSGINFYTLFTDTDSIGYALLGVLLLFLITMPLHNKKSRLAKQGRVLLAFCICSLWVCSVFFPATGLARIHSVFYKYFITIQYQSRFMSVAIVLISCLGAVFLAMNIWGKKVSYFIAAVLCCMAMYQDIGYFETISPDVIYIDSTEISSCEVGHGEYLPVITNIENLEKEVEAEDGIQITAVKREYLTYDISAVNVSDREQKLLLPVLYYSGYRTCDRQNGERLETVAGDNGRVMITIPAGYQGSFRMAFHVPWYWRVSEGISFMTLLFMVVFYWGIPAPHFLRRRQEAGGQTAGRAHPAAP